MTCILEQNKDWKVEFMNRFCLISFAICVICCLPACSWHMLGHSKNGAYMGMSGSTQAMSINSYVPKKVQRQEALF